MEEPARAAGGGARVMGAEGKIKGGGVTPSLTPCLHIGFCNSTPKGRGVTGLATIPAVTGVYWGVTLYLAHATSR